MKVIGQIIRDINRQKQKEEFVKRICFEFPGDGIEEIEMRRKLIRGCREIKWNRTFETDMLCGCSSLSGGYKQVQSRFSSLFKITELNQIVVYAKNTSGHYHVNLNLYLVDDGRLYYKAEFLNSHFGIIDIFVSGEYFLELQICKLPDKELDLEQIKIRPFIILSRN